MEESVPAKAKAPFLIGVGDKPKQLLCYVDAQPLFEAKPEDAVILLMAVYWIFSISFEKDLRQQLILLAISIFGNDSKDVLSPKDLNLLTVLDVVHSANLTL